MPIPIPIIKPEIKSGVFVKCDIAIEALIIISPIKNKMLT